MAKKFSQFPSAASISPGDSVVGLKDGANTRFSFATFLSSIQSLFVPTSRKVNNKALNADITLDASDVGAVDTADVGVADGVASLDNTGKVPSSQLPPISSDASDITYDPTTSGLTATNVQDAIDEVVDDLSGKQSTITASGILKGDGVGGVSAATAGTDYQAPLTAGTDYATPAMIPSVPSAYTGNPEMDGTASPGSSGAWAKGDHVHPSDTGKANQAQLAYVETGTTASRNYAVGEFFCRDGFLYRAKTAISSGAAFTVGTNCEQVTVGAQLADIMPLGMRLIDFSFTFPTAASAQQIGTGISGSSWAVCLGIMGVNKINSAHYTISNYTVEPFMNGANLRFTPSAENITTFGGTACHAFILYKV